MRAFPEKASFHSLMRPRRDSPLTHSLSLSLRLFAPVRASPLQGFGRIEDGRCSKESTGLPPPSSIHRPSTLPVCVVLKRLSSESHDRTVLRIVHTAGARPIEGDHLGQAG